jgi:hypothetical protein
LGAHNQPPPPPPPPVGLECNDFVIKPALSKRLKFNELLENFRFMTQQIDPCKFTIVINEANIIFLVTKGLVRMAPNIRVYKF